LALLLLALCLAGAAGAGEIPWGASTGPWDSADTGWLANNAGESYDPYVISTADELAGLAKLVDGGNAFRYKYFVLAGDIDLGNRNWFPIGWFNSYLLTNGTKPFSGTFDGRGHKISGLYCTSGRIGNLFGYIEKSAVVKNLVVEGSVKGSGVGSDGAGIMAAWVGGTVENCVVSGDVTAGLATARNFGGLAASLADSGTFRNVITFGTVSSPGAPSYAGGVLGYAYASGVRIENCSANASSLVAPMDAGGIIGGNLGLTKFVYNCVSTAQYMNAQYIGGVTALGSPGEDNYNHWLKEPGNPNQPESSTSYGGGGGSAGAKASVALLPQVSVWPLKPIAVAVANTHNVAAELYPSGGSDAGLLYTWTSSKPAVATVAGSGASATLTGVANGKTTLTLRIENPSWKGRGWISVSCPVTVGTGGSVANQPPSAPVNLTATLGENRVTLAWGAPDDDGGSAVTGYEVSDGTGAEWVALASDVMTYTFEGLESGTEYEFGARAVNAEGSGAVATAKATTAGTSRPVIASENAISSSEKESIALHYFGSVDYPLTKDAKGNLILDPAEALTIARETWPDAAFDADGIVSLPLVRAATGKAGGLAQFKFSLKGSALLADRAEEMLVIKILGSGAKAGLFSYAATADAYGDKKFTVWKDGVIYDGEIEPEGDYTFVLFVADNGGFDIDDSPWSVLDPAEILRKPANFSPATTTTSPSGGGGGCAALGFPGLLALAAIPLIRWGRRGR
jgi:hypothetical protein